MRAFNDQKLATPNRTIFPIASTVPGDAQDWTHGTVFDHAREDMRVVMLQLEKRLTLSDRVRLCTNCRLIVRVSVAYDDPDSLP